MGKEFVAGYFCMLAVVYCCSRYTKNILLMLPFTGGFPYRTTNICYCRVGFVRCMVLNVMEGN